LNKYKFENLFLSRLSVLISKIYNKKVEFNIVNLKAIYLNSDIFAQAIALKLRNRDNRLLRVLRSFLTMVKLSKDNILKDRFIPLNNKELWINRVNNLEINYLTLNINKKRDSLNDLLISLFNPSNISGLSKDKKIISNNKLVDNYNLLDDIILILKHKNISGVRLEAKGRLTRRFTASRSIFKIK
jgi:hypothetical protein